jgi:hypothetical protein
MSLWRLLRPLAPLLLLPLLLVLLLVVLLPHLVLQRQTLDWPGLFVGVVSQAAVKSALQDSCTVCMQRRTSQDNTELLACRPDTSRSVPDAGVAG